MSAEDFFSRWERKNRQAQDDKAAESAASETSAPTAAPAPVDPYEGRAPTEEDLEQLTPQADFSPFMKRGVDEGVKRSALKKLFTDPHFNIMDGLDVYIDDYTKSDPIPPEMMAMLEHAKGLLNPEILWNKPVMALKSAEDLAVPEEAPTDEATQAREKEQDHDQAQDSQTQAPQTQAPQAQDPQTQAPQAQDPQALNQPEQQPPQPQPAASTSTDQDHLAQQQATPAQAGKPTSGSLPETETGKS